MHLDDNGPAGTTTSGSAGGHASGADFEPGLSASQDPWAPRYPRYAAASRGLQNYWYPLAFAKHVRRKARSVTVAGKRIGLFWDEEDDAPKALADRCPHRGVPLTTGERIFPGTVTCVYHGWTYRLKSGELEAALTDGPDSPVCGKANVRVQTYPTVVLAGIVWGFVGDMDPVPDPREDIPSEFFADDVIARGFIEEREGNWRYGIENAVDEGHSKMLHRKSLWMRFRRVAGYCESVDMQPLPEDPKWLNRTRGKAIMRADYPGLGSWPPKPKLWQSGRWGPKGLAVRLPATCRVIHGKFSDFQIFVPLDDERFTHATFAVARGNTLQRLAFRLRFQAYIRWAYQRRLLAEDAWMIALMEIPPEQLYRPDVSITSWRKFFEDTAREQPPEIQQTIEHNLALRDARRQRATVE